MHHRLPHAHHKALIPLAIVASFLLLPSLPASQEAEHARTDKAQETEPSSAAPKERISPEIASALESGSPVRVIIYLDLPDPPVSPSRRKHEIGRAQDNVLRGLTDKDFTTRWRYGTVPALAGDLHAPGLAKLASTPGILRVDLDLPVKAHLAQSAPVINADDMHTQGWRGQGVSVAILDSGVQASHPDLSDDIIAQECWCTGGCCPNGSSRMSGSGAAADGAGHGTNVTGIVTANGVISSIGVAPDASIVAIKVLSNLGSGDFTDVIAALDWVADFRPDVKVVNMSLGGGNFLGHCDNVNGLTMAVADVINTLRNQGVITFASSGNDNSGTTMGLPACIANAISVGATYDDNIGSVSYGPPNPCTDSTTAVDKVTCFSNSNSTTDVFAPGAAIRSSGLGSGSVTYHGTSQASPHAAGCAADMLSAVPSLTPTQIENALEASGVPVVDTTNGLTFPRINCAAALTSIGACIDRDHDGYGQPGQANCPNGATTDCDDNRPTIYPGAAQICDGFNNNCSAPGWPTVPANEADGDSDGSPQCLDCNDSNTTVYPGAPQICDGINNNCSAAGWPAVPANEVDGDGDGRFLCNDCNDANAAVYPSAPQICDGLNNDCSHPLYPALTATTEFDDDTDGLSECQGDCNDNNFRVYPGAPQICDGVNNNCSAPGWPSIGGTNDFDDDVDIFSECQGDCNDANAAVYPGAPQVCDGVNNNCSAPGWPSMAGTNDGDDDLDAISECQGDCNDAAGTVFPGAPDLCDGLSNNCLAPGWPALAGTNDTDDDGDAMTECAGDCNDAAAYTYSNAPEANDAVDNQCSGQYGFGVVDEVSGIFGFNDPGSTQILSWPPQAGATGYEMQRSGTPFPSVNPYVQASILSGVTSTDSTTPPPGVALFYLVRSIGPNLGSWGQKSNGQERSGIAQPETLCADAVDNDTDGQIDCGDPDCFVQPACAPATYSFTDTLGDDVTGTSLKDFFTAHPAAASDFLLFSLTGPGVTDYLLCAQRADFYRDGYLSLADTGGTILSGSWNRWTFQEGGSWSVPETASFENRFGINCVDERSWCPEDTLANRSVAVLPEQNSECESLDLYAGCSPGSWIVTVKIGHTRLATCGF